MKDLLVAACAAVCALATFGGPMLRIAVLSDVQGYPFPEDAGMRNLERALDVLSPLKPDVVLSVGDINDSGRNMDAVRYFKNRCDMRLGVLPHVACLGNHELEFIPEREKAIRTPQRCLADFNAVFGFGPTQLVHRVIAGYDFIALSPIDPRGYHAPEIALLKSALDRAVVRDAAKPVFVLTHFHPFDTVNSSYDKREDGGLRALLDGYPQVVSLSGHAHNPLQDPRSIWQGGFTAVETSTLCYGCVSAETPPMANQISSLLPYGHESVGCLFIEVWESRVVIRRFSVRDRREIDPGDPWSFALPYDPKRPTYDFASRAAAAPEPRLPAEAEPTLWYDFGFVYLLFNAVENLDDTFAYRIEVAEEGGVRKTYEFLSDFYRSPTLRAPRICTRVPPDVVRAGGRYRCRIVPVGFFGREGRACEWSFSIRDDYPVRRDKANCMQE